MLAYIGSSKNDWGTRVGNRHKNEEYVYLVRKEESKNRTRGPSSLQIGEGGSLGMVV